MRTALVTTRGFRDVIEIGRQDRADLYDLTAVRPPPLVPRDLRFPVAERMGPEGELAPLDEDDLAPAERVALGVRRRREGRGERREALGARRRFPRRRVG